MTNQPLFELLQQCVVRLQLPDKLGTGFFVAPGLILTCAHVVSQSAGQSVNVYWEHQKETYTAVLDKQQSVDVEKIDLALLKLNGIVPSHSCVYLDTLAETGNKLYSYGYADRGELREGKVPNGEPVSFELEGRTGDDPPLLKFKQGQARPGLSGSPLLNQQTGKVCGVVKTTFNRDLDLGGLAISTKDVLSVFPHLLAVQEQFHKNNTDWSTRLPKPSPEVPSSKLADQIGIVLQDNSSVSIKDFRMN
ncbi:MAG: serine protease [Nostoc sp.]|uniref:S1 family peptidase n=1 Tax=Nostoc sp. TaxID=1180 RepID=UPI002FF64703